MPAAPADLRDLHLLPHCDLNAESESLKVRIVCHRGLLRNG